jgi:hypothetical protein
MWHRIAAARGVGLDTTTVSASITKFTYTAFDHRHLPGVDQRDNILGIQQRSGGPPHMATATA